MKVKNVSKKSARDAHKKVTSIGSSCRTRFNSKHDKANKKHYRRQGR